MIYHITPITAWQTGQTEGIYCPPDFEKENFIHFSTEKQVVATANRYYKGRNDLIILHVDETRLTAPLVYENLLGGQELFPHYYGRLPLDAVVFTTSPVKNSDGIFESI